MFLVIFTDCEMDAKEKMIKLCCSELHWKFFLFQIAREYNGYSAINVLQCQKVSNSSVGTSVMQTTQDLNIRLTVSK